MNNHVENPASVFASVKVQVEHPDCVCQNPKCKSIFRDTYDIFPGPAICPSCVADEREGREKAKKKARRNRNSW